MTPDLDLMLATVERALAAAILPGASNASAKEEASLAILFTRWMREVLDHLPAAERASHRDCRAALGEIAARVEAEASSAAARELAREAGREAASGDAAAPAALRAETRRAKALLGRVLRELRSSGDGALANQVRARLFDLGVAEIERERAFGRPTGLDPDWRSLPSLADLVRDQERNTR